MSKRRRRGKSFEDNGFKEWGGYMEAKKTKLQDQFMIDAAKEACTDSSKIFSGVAIFVNGYSVPSADELKLLMMKHGGVYHHYYRSSKTTHIIATNLPDTKVKQLKNMNVVKPDWIVDSIAAGKLLDYRQYLLYSHHSKTQPKLMFKDVENRTISSEVEVIGSDDVKPGKYSDGIHANEEKENFKSCQETCIFEKKKTDTNSSLDSFKRTSHSIKTAREAGFLSEFYSNSRLHHISTMGATFKQYVNNLRERKTGAFLGAESLKTWKLSQSKDRVYSCNSSTKLETVIMHIDMDCFFVSVGLRKRPELKGFPVAVTHAKGNSGNLRAGVSRKAEFDLYKMKREEKCKAKDQSIKDPEQIKPWSDWVEVMDESDSMSEIASCNYEARKMGLKNGMFLGQALKLCPDLKTIPYDFEGYKEVSYCLYDTVASYTLNIEAVSCDEMFVDCTSLLQMSGVTPLELASILRAEIKEKTGCPCSTGFGANRLQARLATKRAKPDGQYVLEPDVVQAFMADIKVSDLPGVGRSTNYKLASMGINICQDLQKIPLSKLQSEFGMKSGNSLYQCCRGEDTKKLVFGQVRKSVSAEVNYGIRFQNREEADSFLKQLSEEVHNRLQEVGMKAKLITLKLMVRAKDAPVESAKFLGHGVCDHVSRSSSLLSAVSDIDSITREVLLLHQQLNIEPTELRGIGIQLSRLEGITSNSSKNAIDKFLRKKSEITSNLQKTQSSEFGGKKREVNKQPSSTMDNFFAERKSTKSETKTFTGVKPEKAVDIDKDVLVALPENIQKEIMAEYGLTSLEERDSIGYVKQEVEPQVQAGPSTNEHFVYDLGLNYSQIDAEVLEELPLDIQREIQRSVLMKKSKSESKASHDKPVDNNPKLDKDLPLIEIRNLIKAWTKSELHPQQCDISMLADYLINLVTSRQLNSLDICTSCLHRCIDKRRSKEWQEAFQTIVTSLQTAMVAEFGLCLWIPKTFST